MELPGEKLNGRVSQVVFRNEENGYTVLRLSIPGQEEDTTVVGCIPVVSPGETLLVTGSWMRHATYGAQFKAKTVEQQLPQDASGIFEYLCAGAVKGIGAITARKLVDSFGEDTLRVLAEEPDKLASLPGMSPRRARNISDTFKDQIAMRRLLDFLRAHALPPELALPLYRLYGGKSIDQLSSNPYLLTQTGLDVPFHQADNLAVELGMDAADPQRLEAALLFELKHNAGNGHTFLPVDKLLPATARLLSLEGPEALLSALEELCRRRKVVRQTIKSLDCVYLIELYEAEVSVADRLEEMAREELAPPENLDALLDRIEYDQNIKYAPLQKDAICLAASRQLMLLTGGPGTGKTTILRGVLALFDALGLETALAAPTGRAAKRLGDTCTQEGYTIHRLLETHFEEKTGQLTFTHNASDPLKTDAVIVDETSMVDITLMQALLAALRPGTRLVLVGDPNQLPSVGPGSMLADLLRSQIIPSVTLVEIFRQAARSAIIRAAHEIHHGVIPSLNNGLTTDFFFLRQLHSQRAVDTIVELVQTRLPNWKKLPPNQIQVLTPTRKGATGTIALNQALQAALNPPHPHKPQKVFGSITFRLGDRVMQVKNNYDALWTDPRKNTSGLGIFNGDIGQICAVESDGSLTVDFDGRQVFYPPDALGELELAYAITVHKSQGSEYPAVVFACLETPPLLLTRSILYTAVTRAKDLFVSVGDQRLFNHMVENDRPQRRYSALKLRLQGEVN